MAKGGGRAGRGTPAPLSLRGVYGHRLEAIRESFRATATKASAAAIEAGADNAELARIHAKATRQAATSDYNLMIRTYRGELARLKRAGLLDRDVDARSAAPDKGLLARITNLARVARGEQRAVKVPPKAAKVLKDEGYEVRKGRVILSPEFKVSRGGDVTIKSADGFVLQKRIYLNADPEAIDRTVRRVFAGMRDDELVVIKIGDNLTEFYVKSNLAGFLAKLYEYIEAKSPMRYVDLVKIPEAEADDWTAEHTAERLDRQGDMRRARRNERARDIRQRKREREGPAPPRGKGKHIRTPSFPR